MKPNHVNYRRYKNFDLHNFRYDLSIAMDMNDTNMIYEEFENAYLNVLNKHAPIKTKLVRANEAPFMDKELKKSIMTRSRLRNRYLKLPSQKNKLAYKIQRNVCTKLLRKRKRTYITVSLILRIFVITRSFGILLNLFFLTKLMHLIKFL